VTEREKDALRGTRTTHFLLSGRCPKPFRLEETSNSRLASEFIITNAIKPLL